jgi:hypothetical protein
LPKKLAVLAAMLVLVLSMAAPAVAQQTGEVPEQDEVPACVLANACGDTPGEYQYEPEGDAFSVSPESDTDQPFEVASEGGKSVQYSGEANCSECGAKVAQAAQDAIGVEDSDDGTDPTDAFSAAIDAAHSPSGTGDAAASEETRVPVKDTPSYRAAFETAKEAGLDDEAAMEAAEVAVVEASKTRKGGSPSEGLAAAEGKTHKERASKGTDEGKNREDKNSRKDNTQEDDTATDNASEEGVTEDATKEVAASGENDDNLGSGGEDVQTTPAGSRAPLLFGGVAFLALGGYAGLRLAQSR